LKLALVLFLCACSAQPLIVTGESFKALGATFIATADAMDAGLDAKTVTPAQYKVWADFGRRFQASYGPAVDLWQLARINGDPALEREATVILVRLAGELAAFRETK
jgi:hypothetical protein